MQWVERWLRTAGPVRAALVIVIALTFVNLLADAAAASAGYGLRPTFVPIWGAFDDFFMFVLSYPGKDAAAPSMVPGLALRLHKALTVNPYGGLHEVAGAKISHLFVPPLTTLYCLLTAWLARSVDVALLFVATVGALAISAARVASTAVHAGRSRRAAVALALCCYPMLVMTLRGNVYAGACGLLVVNAMLLATRRRAPLLAGLLLAVAVNIRPNAILFAAPLLTLPGYRWPASVALASAGTAIAAVSLAAAHALYPDYTLAAFLAGLGNYYRHYVVDHEGLAYGSSLYGGLRLVFGYRPGLDLAALAPVAALGLAALVRWWRGELSWTVLLFLTCVGYACASTVFADYHLIVFLMVPLAAVASGAGVGRAEWVAILAAALVLAPKNEGWTGVASWQVVINPLLLVAAAGWALWAVAPVRRSAPARVAVAA